jgi:hypothetical protein
MPVRYESQVIGTLDLTRAGRRGPRRGQPAASSGTAGPPADHKDARRTGRPSGRGRCPPYQRPEDQTGGSVLPDRLGMPAQDAAAARRILLGGLARDIEVAELVGELAPLHPRNTTFPGEVFLHVAADALDWCGASRADPLALAGMRERFLPGCAFGGRRNKKLQFAILAAAALRGGTEPGLLDEVAWWQTGDFWQYALHAAVAYIRAATERAGVPVRQVCQELTQRAGPRPE